MDLPECPLCYAPVQIWADGTCPACKKNTNSATEHDRQFSAAEITLEEELPRCCIQCGRDTEHVEYFTYKYDSHLRGDLDEQSFFVFVLIVAVTAGLGLLLLPLYRKRLRKYREITYNIHLPFCESCLPTKNKYEPITIEGNAYHFKVHKNFKNKHRRMHPRKYG